MKYWINKDSEQLRSVSKQQQFFGTEVELPDDLAEAMIEFEQKWRTYQEYLRKVEGILATRDPNINITERAEVPEWLEAEEAPVEEPPKEQDTARRSSKKSPAKRKTKATKSSTSRKKRE